jgi:hypothetical protein
LSAPQRRLHRRSPASAYLEVRYLHARSAPGSDVAVCALDLSPHGIRLVIRQLFTPGDRVEVTLPGEDGPPLKVHGAVVWAAPLPDGCVCAGVQFDAPLPLAEVARLTRPDFPALEGAPRGARADQPLAPGN